MQVKDYAQGHNYIAYNADCIEVTRELDADSVGFIVYSPPFESLYTYSNDERDMGNCSSSSEFFQHFDFLIKEMYRVLQPGRLMAVHCMNLPSSKQNHGFIGIRDFRGDLIRAFQEEGFIYHSEVCIWKDPVVAMQRTKALGLLHKTIKKDSSMSRQGIADYLIVMRKPGDNERPIEGELAYYVGDDPAPGFQAIERGDGSIMWTVAGSGATNIDTWQRYASPVWMDINQTRTLQYQNARATDDERHIAPLQLDVIERAMQLWSREGDVVFSPFMGIGSEGYVALQMGRKFIGAELKESYFALAKRNLDEAENVKQGELFA
ncbi:MAG TPA: site-specific DNA-methyltransferase [Burkholderiaceae bacterium]|nr:site-specific DNA-methyltransferase [Burkholderiaceae bacterium]